MVLKLKKATNEVIEGFLVVTEHQTRGKGQRGNIWLSESGKNLLFSLNLKPSFLSINKIYLINVIVGVAVQKAITDIIGKGQVQIKWPNDIYINDLKVGGILIESLLGKGKIENVIIGVGLNVNQSYFALKTATSLLNETKTHFDRDEILESILKKIEVEYLKLKSGDYKNVLFDYHKNLRWRGEVHSFRSGSDQFLGEIIGINETGKLMVKHNNRLLSYDIKEIEFLI